MSFYDLISPCTDPSPILVEVPHSGLQIPEEVENEIRASPSAVLRDSDLYVDQLYERAPEFGAAMVVARASRYVVDLNRSPAEIDLAAVPKHPKARAIPARGVVWRATTDGTPLLRAPLRVEQFNRRMKLFYEPYHLALRSTAERIRREHGQVLILAAHSMPSKGRRLPSGEHVPRADVVPGTCGRSTADGRIIDLIDAHFRDAGLSVRHDDPYRGGWTTQRYGIPTQHCHAIQIELNRALYVDEETSEPKKDDFGKLQKVLSELIAKLAATLRSQRA